MDVLNLDPNHPAVLALGLISDLTVGPVRDPLHRFEVTGGGHPDRLDDQRAPPRRVVLVLRLERDP